MLDTLMVPPIIFFALLFIIMVVVAWRCKHERLVTFWYIWSLFIQGLLEFNYGLTHSTLRAAHFTTFVEYAITPVPASSFFTSAFYTDLYGQYAKYDYRYTNSNTTAITLTIAEIIDIVGYIYLLWAVQVQHKWRHPVQLALNFKITYATTIFLFAPFWDGTWYYEFFYRGANLPVGDMFEFIVYVMLLNGLWIIFPIILTWQSWQYLGKALDVFLRGGNNASVSNNKKRN